MSITSFASIFSHSVGYLFILFMVSFAVQKLLNLNRSHLLIFVFICITLGSRSKKILLQFMSKSVLPMFSSKSFITSDLTIRSLIHFDHWNIFLLAFWILWYHYSILNMYSLIIFLNILLEKYSIFTLLFKKCFLSKWDYLSSLFRIC